MAAEWTAALRSAPLVKRALKSIKVLGALFLVMVLALGAAAVGASWLAQQSSEGSVDRAWLAQRWQADRDWARHAATSQPLQGAGSAAQPASHWQAGSRPVNRSANGTLKHPPTLAQALAMLDAPAPAASACVEVIEHGVRVLHCF